MYLLLSSLTLRFDNLVREGSLEWKKIEICENLDVTWIYFCLLSFFFPILNFSFSISNNYKYGRFWSPSELLLTSSALKAALFPFVCFRPWSLTCFILFWFYLISQRSTRARKQSQPLQCITSKPYHISHPDTWDEDTIARFVKEATTSNKSWKEISEEFGTSESIVTHFWQKYKIGRPSKSSRDIQATIC